MDQINTAEHFIQFLETFRDVKLNELSLRAIRERWREVEAQVPIYDRFEGPRSYGPVLKTTVDILNQNLELHPLTTEEWGSVASEVTLLVYTLLKFVSTIQQAVATDEEARTVMMIATMFLPPCRHVEDLKFSMAKINGFNILSLVCWESYDFNSRMKIFELFKDVLLPTFAKAHGRSSSCQVLIERLVEMFETIPDFDLQLHASEALVRFALARNPWKDRLEAFFTKSPEIGVETRVIQLEAFDGTQREFLVRANKHLPLTSRVFSMHCVQAYVNENVVLHTPAEFTNLWLDLSPFTGKIQMIFSCDSSSFVKISIDVNAVAAIHSSTSSPSEDEIQVRIQLNKPWLCVPFKSENLLVKDLTAILKKDEHFYESEKHFFMRCYPKKYYPTRLSDKEKDDEPIQPMNRSAISPVLLFGPPETSGIEDESDSDCIQNLPPLTGSCHQPPRSSITGSLLIFGSRCEGVNQGELIDLTACEESLDSLVGDPNNVDLNLGGEESQSPHASQEAVDVDSSTALQEESSNDLVGEKEGLYEGLPTLEDGSPESVTSCDDVQHSIPAISPGVTQGRVQEMDFIQIESSFSSCIAGPLVLAAGDSHPVTLSTLLPTVDCSHDPDSVAQFSDKELGGSSEQTLNGLSGFGNDLTSFEDITVKLNHPLVRHAKFNLPDTSQPPVAVQTDAFHPGSVGSASLASGATGLETKDDNISATVPHETVGQDENRREGSKKRGVFSFSDDELVTPCKHGYREKSAKRMKRGDERFEDALAFPNQSTQGHQILKKSEGDAQGSASSPKERESSPHGCTKQEQSTYVYPESDPNAPSRDLFQRSGNTGCMLDRTVFSENPMFFRNLDSKPVKKPLPKKRRGFVRGKGRSFTSGIPPGDTKPDLLRSETSEASTHIDPVKPEVAVIEAAMVAPPLSPPGNSVEPVVFSPPPPIEEPVRVMTRNKTKRSPEKEPSKEPNKPVVFSSPPIEEPVGAMARNKTIRSLEKELAEEPNKRLKSQKGDPSEKGLGRSRASGGMSKKKKVASPEDVASTSSGLGSLDGSDASPEVTGRRRASRRNRLSPVVSSEANDSLSNVTRHSQRLVQKSLDSNRSFPSGTRPADVELNSANPGSAQDSALPSFGNQNLENPELSSERDRFIHEITDRATDVVVSELRRHEAEPLISADLTFDSIRSSFQHLRTRQSQVLTMIRRGTDFIEDSMNGLSDSFTMIFDFTQEVNNVHANALAAARRRHKDPRTFRHLRQEIHRAVSESVRRSGFFHPSNFTG